MNHTPGRWTPEEDAYLLAHYATEPMAALAAALGTTVGTVRQRFTTLRHLGVRIPGRRVYHPAWTALDDQELSGRWRHESAQAIAALLGRSVTAIRQRAAILKLGRCGPGFTSAEVATLFGVDSHLVVLWCRRGWLKGRQVPVRIGRGKRWAISVGAVEDFIVASPYHFDYRVMQPDTWYRELAERETKRQRWLTIRQAARRLGCHPGTVHNHLRKGLLPGMRTTGASWQGDYRIREDDLALFQPRRPLHGKGGRGRPGMRRREVVA